MPDLRKFPEKTSVHVVIFFVGYLLDQATKFWAESALVDKYIRVLGDLLRFKLAYNEGAAFSMRPQELLPWMHPTLFYILLSIVASTGLVWFYRSTEKSDWPSRIGVAMILSGALGNISDRLRIHKVVDFIDSDFPDFIMTRWPTFNIADSCVCVGVGLILLSPYILKKKNARIGDSDAKI